MTDPTGRGVAAGDVSTSESVKTRYRAGHFLVGVGVGALIDGFILHQVLQWHHLVSRKTPVNTVAGLEENTLADGIFHLGSLLVLLVGVLLLVGRPIEPGSLIGWGLMGWGAFHVLDQILFHLLLKAHHIRENVANPEVYDWTFFAIGVLLMGLGATALIRRKRG